MQSHTTTNGRLSVAGAILFLLGLLLTLVPVAGWNTPASAAPVEDCSDLTFQAGRVIEKVVLEADGITIDTSDGGTTCQQVGNALQLAVDGEPVIIEDGVTDAPNLHTSCSVDYDGVDFTLGDTTYTITDHAFTVSNFPGGSAGTCATIDPSASLECAAREEDDNYDVTVTFNPGGSTKTFWFTEDNDQEYELARGVTTYETGAGILIEIEAEDGDPLLASLTTAPPDCPANEPTPAISLTKVPVLNADDEASDLAVNEANANSSPALFWIGEDDTADKTAVYAYTIENTGNEALALDSLVDSRSAIGEIDLENDSDCPEFLEVGDSCTATASETFTRAQAEEAQANFDISVTNTAEVTAFGVESQQEVDDTSEATIFLITFNPFVEPVLDISLVKEVVLAGDVAELGDFNNDGNVDDGTITWQDDEIAGGSTKAVTYRFTITNESGTTLYDVELTDPMLGGVIGTVPTLAAGASTTVDVSHDLPAADAFPSGLDGANEPVDNTATVIGYDETREFSASDSDIARVVGTVVFPEEPTEIAIDLTKQVVAGGDVAEVGDFDSDGDADDGTIEWAEAEVDDGATKTVVYRFTITNTGDVTLYDVELSDPMISDELLIAAAEGVTLEPGESMTVDREYELAAGDAFPDGTDGAITSVDNTASASGTNQERTTSVEDDDDAVVVGTLVFDEVLPETGFTNAGLVPVALLLLAAGAALLGIERRQRRVA